MILHPDAQRVLELIRLAGRPPIDQMTPAEARAGYLASRPVMQPDPPEVAETRALVAPGPAGDIPLRLYRPLGSRPGEVLPVLVFFHGGGWVIGDLESHDQAVRALCNASGGCVVAVDYRLAPEHRFPAAVLDAAAGTKWIVDQAGALSIDADRVAVGGDSAGGNLAAVMALMARDGSLPPVSFQLLIYPATDMAMTSDSVRRIDSGYPLTSVSMRYFLDHYLNGPDDVHDWRASPARAASLAGTAPAMVITCSHDPLVDEGAAYARRLEDEGVDVVYVNFAGLMHGFLTMGRLIRDAGLAVDMMGAALRARWAA